jgi:hypothetical protein
MEDCFVGEGEEAEMLVNIVVQYQLADTLEHIIVTIDTRELVKTDSPTTNLGKGQTWALRGKAPREAFIPGGY